MGGDQTAKRPEPGEKGAASTATVSVIITQGVWIWNDYFFNMIFITKASQSPLPLAMLGFMGDQQNPTQWNVLFAACFLCALPLLVAFTFMQQ